MELIYIYIDKYRTFENQEISFSNKFNVNYDNENNVLTIKKNEDSENIYPQNIVNINGILGKNASGKSSLISLIGKQIDDRTDNNGMFLQQQKKPYEVYPNLDDCICDLSLQEPTDYKSSYFLLYYVGKNDGNSLFVFETNNAKKYIDIFDNLEGSVKEKILNSDKIKYRLDGWLSVVFKVKNGNNEYINDVSEFNSKCINFNNDFNIINFRRPVYINLFNSERKYDDDYNVSLKRREALLESNLFKNKIKFLINQMKPNSSKSTMYKNKFYRLKIALFNPSRFEINDKKGDKIQVDKIIKNFKYFDIEQFEEWQKIILAFLFLYVCYEMRIANITGYLKPLIQKLSNIQIKNDSSSYENIKKMYHNQIECFYSTNNNSLVNLDEFLKSENALENFLKKAKQNNINYSYDSCTLVVDFNKDSKIDEFNDFFDHFIDEYEQKGKIQEPTIMNDFLNVDIPGMSDGEKENLALFTSIDEQIRLLSYKKKFILLFDEIERSMHPDLCRNLVSNLVDFLKQYPDKEFQIIIASHSPFIAGDLLQENIVCLSRKDDKSFVSNMAEKPFAQNIHTILKSQFFLDSFIGEYARKCIDKIIKCLKYEKIDEVKNELNEFFCSDKESDAKIIDSAEKAKKYIEYVIDSIGEPIIRNELHRRLSNAKWLSAEEKIQYYQNKIRELEESLND